MSCEEALKSGDAKRLELAALLDCSPSMLADMIQRLRVENAALLEACKVALEVVRRHDAGLCEGVTLDAYCGEDELVDKSGVMGLGDLLRSAISLAEKGASK